MANAPKEAAKRAGIARQLAVIEPACDVVQQLMTRRAPESCIHSYLFYLLI
jgi:hypothetical protein